MRSSLHPPSHFSWRSPAWLRPATPAAPSIAAAVACTARSADNVKLDVRTQARAGAAVPRAEARACTSSICSEATRYWAEIMAPAVGPKGHDTVWEPTQFYSDETKQAFAAFAAKHPNVSIVVSPFEAPELPKNSFDFVILNDNYHDTYWQSEKNKIPRMDPAAFLERSTRR